MGKRVSPSASAEGAVHDPVAPAPALANGLNKYFTAQLMALTGGTMDAPLCEPGSPPLPVLLRKSRFIRHRHMTFLTR